MSATNPIHTGAALAVTVGVAYLDTVHVWPGESVDIALDFSHSNPGDQDYAFHCHNLEQRSSG